MGSRRRREFRAPNLRHSEANCPVPDRIYRIGDRTDDVPIERIYRQQGAILGRPNNRTEPHSTIHAESKTLENWWVWMTADVVYVLLYCYKALYLTGILYAGFFALCVVGYQGWRKTLRSAALKTAVTQA